MDLYVSAIVPQRSENIPYVTSCLPVGPLKSLIGNETYFEDVAESAFANLLDG
jgi:hypothetical protein